MRALVLGTLAVLLAGCLSPSPSVTLEPNAILTLAEIEQNLSAPVYDAIERTEAVVPMSDGVRIRLNIFQPAGAEEALPVILEMTPYTILAETGRSCMEVDREDCALVQELVDYFVPRGYAVVFADVRGHHDSTGCSEQVGPRTWQDGYELVEWLAARPWSNGRVGMYGGSFDGEVQLGTAILDPPHLVTIVPGAAGSNGYGHYYYEGVPYFAQGPSNAAAMLALSAVPGTDPDAFPDYPQRLECQPANLQAQSDQTGDWNAYWEARDFRPRAHEVRASVLQVHGLQDWNVKPDHLDGFWNDLTSEKRLLVGQWGHQIPDRADWPLIRHRWFDHYLRDIDTGILQDLPLVLIEGDTGTWHGIEAFPPPVNETVTFYLTADGKLSTEPPAEGTLILRDYPRAFGGNYDNIVATPGVLATGVPDELVFETDALPSDLRYVGRPVLHLVASTDAESTHWVGLLIDTGEPPTGYGSEGINRGFLDTRHRVSVKEPSDLTPGEQYAATLRMYPQDDVIQKDSRLRLVLSNNDNFIQQDTTFATSTVFLGPEGTRLVLPLAPPGRPIPEDALRDDLRSDS